MIFGIRFSNLTYRGVLTNGPYRFTRHPAYLSKNLFWWASVLPFLVDERVGGRCGSQHVLSAGGQRQSYYWRARTEEAHLLAEDPKYAEYHAWMAQHGLITAPLTRLARLVTWARGEARQGCRGCPGRIAPYINGAPSSVWNLIASTT